MSHIVMALYKHLDKFVANPIYEHTTFDDIRDFAIKRWCSLTHETINISYSIPGYSFCDLLSEDDYKNMVIMISIHKLKTIEITVLERGHCVQTVAIGQEIDNIDKKILLLDKHGLSDSVSSDNDDMLHAEIDDQGPLFLSFNWKSLIVGVNQEFIHGAKQFRSALVRFSMYYGFEITYLKNETTRITAVCKSRDLGCLWRIHATSDSSSIFYIRNYEPSHSCGCGLMIRNSKRMNSYIVAEEVADKIRSNPLYRPIDVFKEFPKTHGCDISYDVAYSAVEKAKEILYGDYYLSYDETRLYLDVARETNPGSHFSIETDSLTKRFKRMFVSFHACIVGFNYCRPMLFLDGTFLTGRFRGQMLCATSKDGNNGLFLLAFAVVDSENIENWTWFMEQLRVILIPNREITFISDRHKGLIEAVSTIFPGFPHGYCTIHLKNNLRSCMSGKPAAIKESILKIFDKLTYAATEKRFEEKLAEFKMKGGKKVSDYIDSISPHHYSHAFFRGLRYGEVTSNAAESINHMYRNERRLPILGLIDGIRVRLMKQFTSNRDNSSNWNSNICPRIIKLIHKKTQFGQAWSCGPAGNDIYEVSSKKSVLVNLSLQTCTCYGWQINKFPCSHALAVIDRCGKDIDSFIDDFYHKKNYQLSYALSINPVSTIDMPPTSRETAQVLPPISKSQPGRRRVRRILSTGEFKRTYKCRRCGKDGHNKKGCRERVEENL